MRRSRTSPMAVPGFGQCESRPTPRPVVCGRDERAQRAVPVSRGRQAELPTEGRSLRGGSRPLALGNPLLAWAPVGGLDEGLVCGDVDATLLAGSHQRRVHREFSLLLERLVIVGEEFI